MKIIRFFSTIPLLAPTLLAGCATVGNDFSWEDANKVQNGMTHEQVITIMKSKPYSVSGSNADTLVWLMSHANGFTGGSELKKVTFTFDKEGKVYGVPEIGIAGKVNKYN